MRADGRARAGAAGLLDAAVRCVGWAVGCAGRMREDVAVVMDRDPAVNGLGEALLSPSLAALWLHRVAHTAYRRRHRVLARAIFLAGRQLSGIEIHPGAVVGRRPFIDHGAATVIGETAVIGDDVTIYHQVTLGAVGWWRDNRRAHEERRHPVVGDRVVLGASCVVLGPVTIGDDVCIGAQALVCQDVPAGALVRAQPCQVVSARRASATGLAPTTMLPVRTAGGRTKPLSVSEAMPGDHDRVVLLMGELPMLIQHPRLIEEVLHRDATPVAVFMTAADAERFDALRADPGHELSGLGGVLHVADATARTVIAATAPLRERIRVAGVIPIGERFVEAAAVLSDLLGLPGPGWRAAHVSRDKVLQRRLFADMSPASRPVLPNQRDSLLADRVRYPAVVKPSSRWGSMGVLEVRTPADLRRAVSSYPAQETLLVEDRVDGPEFSVESLVQGGQVLWAGITRKATNEAESSFFAEMGQISPADDLTVAEEGALLAASADVVRRLALADGIAHCELRLAGDPVLMEVAVRMPPSISPLWWLATGQPLESAVADIAMGIPASYPPPSRRAGRIWSDPPQGSLRSVACDAAEVSWGAVDQRWPQMRPVFATAPARCCAVLVSRRPGDMLGPVSDNPSRAVSVVVDAPLDVPLAKLGEAAAEAVLIEVGP